MRKMEEKLADIFDVELPPVQQDVLPPIESPEKLLDDGAEMDFEFARRNMKELIEKGNLAVDDIIEVAKATDHPRAFEVAATMITSVAAMNKDLMELRKKKQDLTGGKKSQPINVDKAVFIGSTTDLIRLIKENK